MSHAPSMPLVSTIPERCRVCYTCVRECPAKAIRISRGQAEVVHERCIGCGHCVQVCSQSAKAVLDSTAEVRELVASDRRVALCLAPSFPAEFTDLKADVLVGRLRALGFDLVCEVAAGADLVARRYREMMEGEPHTPRIATTCPAVVSYVEQYRPASVPLLAPLVSPMVALARMLHHLHGPDLAVVFAGPCIAKKEEAADPWLDGEVEAVLTFLELRELLQEVSAVEPSDFDPPWPGLGSLFPVGRGLLEAAGLDDGLLLGHVMVTDGNKDFAEGIKELESGALEVGLLEVLCCEGCIMGPAYTTEAPRFKRQSRVIQQARSNLARRDGSAGVDTDFAELDLGRAYRFRDTRMRAPSEDELRPILVQMGKHATSDELNCGACGYETCREHAKAIYQGLAELEMCLPHTIEHLRVTVTDLAQSNEVLADTRQALARSEKLASMGQLAAGIAHEVNNPLGVVLIYAHLLMEEAQEGSELMDDLQMIVTQAERCKKIVAGLLDFSRQNKGTLQEHALDALVKEGMRALPAPAGISVALELHGESTTVQVDGDQLIQVLTNLVRNAYDAMAGHGHLQVQTRSDADNAWLIVRDDGCGIPEADLGNIFEPFFTTKPVGKGTGLGLAVTYGIIKMHRGGIEVRSNTVPQAGPTGTAFTVRLPRRADPRDLPAEE